MANPLAMRVMTICTDTDGDARRNFRNEYPLSCMTIQTRELYCSPNGDRWHLCRDDTGAVFITHEPNIPSGGRASTTELRDFLARGAHGPEHQALLRLIGTLVENEGDKAPTQPAR
jgi:hypothetical protein